MNNMKPIKGRDAIIAAEGFVADVQFRIQTLLNDHAMKRADLARRLNVSEARVSHMFAAEARNLTLRTVAKILHALGEECYVTSPRLEELLGPPALDMEVYEEVSATAGEQTRTAMIILLSDRSSQARRSYAKAKGVRSATGDTAIASVPIDEAGSHAA